MLHLYNTRTREKAKFVPMCGTTDWVFGLGDPRVARVTANVLDRYLD